MQSLQSTSSTSRPDCALCAGLLARKAENAANPPKENPDNSDSLVANVNLTWNSLGRPLELKICFSDDSKDVKDIQKIKKQIVDYAKLWTQPGVIEDIKLTQLDKYDQNAHIRIRIVPEKNSAGAENGNFSWVGTNSLYKNQPSNTSMQLAVIGVEDKEDNKGINMFRRRVLHEFGHALGFEHEQSRAPWAPSNEKVTFPINHCRQ